MSRYKFLTFNIHKGYGPFNLFYNIKDIKAYLKKENADVVFLQEAVGEKKGFDQIDFLSKNLYPYFLYGGNNFHKKGHHGNAILSKAPLELKGNHNISQNKLEKRGLLHAVATFGEKEVHLLNTHLNLLEYHRKKQISWILSYISRNIPNQSSTILAGDFNDWRGKVSKVIYQETDLLDVFKKIGCPKTFPSFLPGLTLDKIFYKNMSLINGAKKSEQRLYTLSDHIPLEANFFIR